MITTTHRKISETLRFKGFLLPQIFVQMLVGGTVVVLDSRLTFNERTVSGTATRSNPVRQLIFYFCAVDDHQPGRLEV